MKKFLSFLTALTMTSCAFISCGKVDEDSGEQGTSVSEEDTSSDREQPDTEEDTDNIQPEADKGSVLGKWEFEDDGMVDVTILEIKDRACAAVTVEQALSEQIYFDEEKNFVFPGSTFSPDDYDFDGKTFVLHGMNENDLTMEKIDGSDDLFGKYRWVSGGIYDNISYTAAGGEAPMFMECTEKSTMLYLKTDVTGFDVTDDTITIEGGAFNDNALLKPIKNAPYTVDGDVMTVTNADDEELKFTRIREKSTSESDTNIIR